MSLHDMKYDFSAIGPEKRSFDFATAKRRTAFSGADDEPLLGGDDDERKKAAPPRRRTGVIVLISVVLLALIVLLVCVFTLPAATPATVTTAATTTAATTVAPPTTPAPTTVLVTSGTPSVDISFACNHVLSGADAGFCLALFSYDNPTGEPITVPIGANNYMLPGPLAVNHPTQFVAGTRFGAVTSR